MSLETRCSDHSCLPLSPSLALTASVPQCRSHVICPITQDAACSCHCLCACFYHWQVDPPEFAKIMHLMESRYGAADFVLEHQPDALRPGTFYLTRVDDLYRRSYARKDKVSPTPNGVHAE